jgi:predicted nucleotidyltransferase
MLNFYVAMNLTELRQSNQLLFESISGSRAYGLDLPGSDTDYRGVFILSKKQFYGLKYTEQINSSNNLCYQHHERRDRIEI